MPKENQPVRDHLAYLLREARSKNFHHISSYEDLRYSYYINIRTSPTHKLGVIRFWAKKEFEHQASLNIGG